MAHQVEHVSSMPAIETCKEQIKRVREQALEVMKQTQELLIEMDKGDVPIRKEKPS
jgi:hypothetical protein